MTSEPTHNPTAAWMADVIDSVVETTLLRFGFDDVDLAQVDATEAREIITALIGGVEAGLWRVLHTYEAHAVRIGEDLVRSWARTGSGFGDLPSPYGEEDAEILDATAAEMGRVYGPLEASMSIDGTVRITVPGIEEWRREAAAWEQALEMCGEG